MAHVLVTDDNGDMRRLLATALEEEGHTVAVAQFDELSEALDFLMTTSHGALAKRRQDELDKAKLLSRLETIFEEPR